MKFVLGRIANALQFFGIEAVSFALRHFEEGSIIDEPVELGVVTAVLMRYP